MYFKPWVVAAFVALVRASESGVEEEASLQSSTLSGGDYFGGAVSAASGTVLVSAYLDGTGSVYTFEKNNFDAWCVIIMSELVLNDAQVGSETFTLFLRRLCQLRPVRS